MLVDGQNEVWILCSKAEATRVKVTVGGTKASARRVCLLAFLARSTNHFIFFGDLAPGSLCPHVASLTLTLRDTPLGAMKGKRRRYVRSMLARSTDKEHITRMWPFSPLYAARLRQQRVRRKEGMTKTSPKERRANGRHHIRTILPCSCPQPR